jgi:hypothetical protein
VQPVSVWLTLAVMVFGAIHLAAWNFSFPSKVERIMWRMSSTAITLLPLFSLLNSSMSSKLHAAKREVRHFNNSLISLWEDYFAYSSASRQPGHANSFPHLFGLRSLGFGGLVVEMSDWENREQAVAAFRTFLSTLPPNPWNQLRTENFEWFMTDLMERKCEWRQSSLYAVVLLEWEEIWQSLKKKAGGELSILDRAAVVIGHIVGPFILLTTGFLYFIFRVCIIVLALTSLRSMPDSVYDATWAKNIPSVQ